MKLLTILFLTLLSFGLKTDNLTQDLKEAKIKIDLPNDSWFLADKQETKGMTVYYFKRKPIEDNEGRKIIPNISVIIEDVDRDLDAVTYSAMKRSKVNFKVLEVFTHESGTIKYENAIGYKGSYVDKNELDHTIYIVHGINGKKGLQFICDVTTNILDQVDNEFLTTLKSIRK
jgi:hypothetical protein